MGKRVFDSCWRCCSTSPSRLFGLFRRVSSERSWNCLWKLLSRVFTPDQRRNYKYRQRRVQNDAVFPRSRCSGWQSRRPLRFWSEASRLLLRMAKSFSSLKRRCRPAVPGRLTASSTPHLRERQTPLSSALLISTVFQPKPPRAARSDEIDTTPTHVGACHHNEWWKMSPIQPKQEIGETLMLNPDVTVVSSPTGCNRSLNYFSFSQSCIYSLLDWLLISSVSNKNMEMVHVWKHFSATLLSFFSPAPHSRTSSESHLFYFPFLQFPLSLLSSFGHRLRSEV